MRMYIDLPEETIDKVHDLAVREDRFPKQQLEHLVKLAIAAAFRALAVEPEEQEVANVDGSSTDI